MSGIAIDPTPFYEQRIIVLMESRPQSNEYHQVFLTLPQFVVVMSNIGTTVTPPEGTLPNNQPMYKIETDESHSYVLHSEIRTINRA